MVTVTYPVCIALLRLGVKEQPGTGCRQCGKKLGAGLLLGMSFGLKLCQAEMSLSCVVEPSGPASSQDLSFLAGLVLTVRHPPYRKLVISFLFISAAVQVLLAGPIPIGSVQSLIPTTSQLDLSFNR